MELYDRSERQHHHVETYHGYLDVSPSFESDINRNEVTMN